MLDTRFHIKARGSFISRCRNGQSRETLSCTFVCINVEDIRRVVARVLFSAAVMPCNTETYRVGQKVPVFYTTSSPIVKYWPIITILSLSHSPENLQYPTHLTSNVLAVTLSCEMLMSGN